MANPARRNTPSTRRPRAVGITTRLAAQLSILATFGGIPYALYALAGNPLPDQLPTWSHLGELLTGRDDGSVFLTAITWAGWIGWASFALPLLLEIICHIFRWRPPRILGLAWQQRRAAALVAAALSISAAPAVASANAITMPSAPLGVAASHSSTAQAPTTLNLASFNTAPPTSFTTERTATANAPVYEVARGDWLYHIAERFLDDGNRYVDIANLNPELEKADPRFPNHIVAGQKLRLPADADDRGSRHHATGKLRTHPKPPTTENAPGATPSDNAPATVTPSHPPPASATPTPSTTASAAPTPEASAPATPTPHETAAPAPTSAAAEDQPGANADDSDIDAALPITAALATAGLLAALLLFRLTQRRRRQRQHRRPGRRIPTPNPTIERRVRAAAQPVDVNRLDHALRALAVGLRDHNPADLPDLAAAWLSNGEVHLMLAQANTSAPPPFQPDGTAMNWMLPATASLPNVEETLAPLPVLVTVASRPGGDHLLVDLERTGLLTISGDADRAADLIRYIAAELATNQWSDDAEVVLAGFDPTDADNLIAIGGNRITAATSTTGAIERARRRAAANAKAMTDTGITSTFAGRVGDIVADAWMPHVLLIAEATDAEEHLTALAAELRLAGRCAVAVAVVTDTPTTWQVDVSTDGSLVIDWLSITNTAATRLPRDQLTRLAPVMRAARAAAPTEDQPGDEPVPAAPEPDPWAEGTDAHGHLLDLNDMSLEIEDEDPDDNEHHEVRDDPAAVHPTTDEHAQERRPAVPEPDRSTPAPAQAGTTVTQPVDITALTPIANGATPRTGFAPSSRQREPHDPTLDDDLDGWYRPDPYRPRIAILGPVEVDAPGEMPDERIRFYSELVVYLAQRGRAGATGEQIDDALWPERGVNARSRRVAISKVRRWLGENAEGTHWLPPNAGADRLYRLTPGVLIDWQLFRRLRARGEARGAAGAPDLRRALELVRGEPLAGAELPYSSGYRNPYTWLPGSDVQPHNLASAVVDTAHQLVDLYLEAGDTSGARWAVERAWLADPTRLDDHPWVDAMRVAHVDGRSAELRALLDDLVRTRDVEVPEDLSPDTYAAIHELVGDLLRIG
ncbi:LysM peptidoglycan-binding domain-containing protein [Micromonospora sp. Llam7]|uniref:LysM peptidoglycan-binding domain-containing protein n=1 Tax=Micromonospora tarapacensis TaxID=2835305 RepID=UPI001C8349F7|nr:LysM peptidoglycan-binding domain-containing protein [Micromonospora tarapacensis]MBX7268922.1 LysM peptidoglycan-binding domain-containing protein [Micromonospora tarapacensis]